ncbi:Chromatin modification-related protein eaf7 protein [Lasiodiplodia theobromae]|uniref:Chromatin modification-related protein eaf7 protein n=1 Tax=Lasiodiplodia theobromae TaxID=45133 RepID=UPI0015C387EC|nr:Chromatin modification-related protein eaf7 protein [Lasiodiplodia theobromae]KAF4536862.1 Chromatin modification-related protein eaf7 protein [Lasiodiplodia theobromae]
MCSPARAVGFHPTLPPELWDMILGMVDHSTRRSLRLSSRELCRIVTPYVFREIHFDLDEGGVDGLVAIASHGDVRQYVRTLVLQRRRGLRKFPGFSEWEDSIDAGAPATHGEDDGGKGTRGSDDDGRSDVGDGDQSLPEASAAPSKHEVGEARQGLVSVVGEEGGGVNGSGSMSGDLHTTGGERVEEGDDGSGGNQAQQAPWLALSQQERQWLYEEYEADRASAHDYRCRLTCCIRVAAPGCAVLDERICPGPAHDDPAQSVLDGLETAVAGLPKLKEFRHQPAYLFDNLWSRRWRDLRFTSSGIARHTDELEDEDIEALQLSLSLRALGLAHHAGVTVDCTTLFVSGPAFWGASNLRRLWDWDHACDRRTSRQQPFWGLLPFDDEEQAEVHRLNARFGNREAAVAYREHVIRGLFTMETAFARLSTLDLEIKGGENEMLTSIAPSVASFVTRCGNLERARLVFREDEVFDDSPRIAYPRIRRVDGNAAEQLLTRLARACYWPRLQKLELSVVVEESVLVKFLSNLAPSLRHLLLKHVALVPGGSRWESLLSQLATRLQLSSVELFALEDNARPRGRILLAPMPQFWPSTGKKPVCYNHYESAVTDYVLKRSSTELLLDPATFFRHHIPHCLSAQAWVSECRKRKSEASRAVEA